MTNFNIKQEHLESMKDHVGDSTYVGIEAVEYIQELMLEFFDITCTIEHAEAIYNLI